MVILDISSILWRRGNKPWRWKK